MSHKQLLFQSVAREKVLRGATTLADAVRVTLGPESKSVLIEKNWGAPLVYNDGVTIAKEVELKDRWGRVARRSGANGEVTSRVPAEVADLLAGVCQRLGVQTLLVSRSDARSSNKVSASR